MRKRGIGLGLLLFVLILSPIRTISAADGDFNDWFENDTVATYIAGLLGKSVTEVVTQAELDTIIKFETYGTGVENLMSLEELAPLQNLNIIKVSQQKLKNVNGIDNFANLKELDINENPIETLQGLEVATTLTQLSLYGAFTEAFTSNDTVLQPVFALTNLENLLLRKLEIRDVLLNGIEALQNVKFINLASNRITDFEVISTLSKLDNINITNNGLTNLTGIENLSLLRTINISNHNPILVLNGVTDYSKIKIFYEKKRVGLDIDRQAVSLPLKYDELKAVYYIEFSGIKATDSTEDETTFVLNTEGIQNLVSINTVDERFEIAASDIDSINSDNYLASLYLRTSNNTLLGRVFIFSDKLDTTETSSVIVKYEDTLGNELLSPVTLSGNVGENYVSTPEMINGYLLSEIPENMIGTFTQDIQTVTFVYMKDTELSFVVVHYIDTEGNKLIDSDVLIGNVGDVYTTAQVDIKGYTLLSTPTFAIGVYTSTIQTIYYFYEKIKDPVEIPTETTPPKDNENPKMPDPKSGTPKTGISDDITSYMTMIFVATILLVLTKNRKVKININK